jgi:hypothetical protein
MTKQEVFEWIKSIGSIGGFAGIITLLWKIVDLLGAYLFLEISIENDRDVGLIHIRTCLENKSLKAKKLDAAFLLISPENDLPDDTFCKLMTKRFSTDNEAVAYVASRMKDNTFSKQGISDKSGRLIIPLTYYFWEQTDVGDERLSYEKIIHSSDFPKNAVYAVRFYIHGKRRLHRVVHATFDTFSGSAVTTVVP